MDGTDTATMKKNKKKNKKINKSGVHFSAKEETSENKNSNPKGLCSSKGEGCFLSYCMSENATGHFMDQNCDCLHAIRCHDDRGLHFFEEK